MAAYPENRDISQENRAISPGNRTISPGNRAENRAISPEKWATATRYPPRYHVPRCRRDFHRIALYTGASRRNL
jgi:hypothetical protein